MYDIYAFVPFSKISRSFNTNFRMDGRTSYTSGPAALLMTLFDKADDDSTAVDDAALGSAAFSGGDDASSLESIVSSPSSSFLDFSSSSSSMVSINSSPSSPDFSSSSTGKGGLQTSSTPNSITGTFLNLRKSTYASSFLVKNTKELPDRPARADRPTRCTYEDGSTGASNWMVQDTSVMSSPRAATSVQRRAIPTLAVLPSGCLLDEEDNGLGGSRKRSIACSLRFCTSLPCNASYAYPLHGSLRCCNTVL
mmetsp:Transcript_18147/g.32879  ORF Transcript_18147/g.32879 Transcript_18147/m.32879 type:complete len:252 (+) Transcript_18147:618-1373(+)